MTFEEAVFGTTKKLEISLKEECASCHGSGAKAGTHPETCPKCGGKGQVVYTQQSMFGTVEKCPDMSGLPGNRSGDRGKMSGLPRKRLCEPEKKN